jgi:hypothetical protein
VFVYYRLDSSFLLLPFLHCPATAPSPFFPILRHSITPPKHLISCPASKFSGLGQLILLYHQITSILLSSINQLYLLRDLGSTLPVTNTPLLFTLYSPTQTSTPHFITSHQSQHHLNAHPTASDRSTLDDHHYSIILKHDHPDTSRCPALFSLIDPILPP